MSLFNRTIVSKKDQKAIIEYLDGDYCITAWNKISVIELVPGVYLWNAVTNIKPKYMMELKDSSWRKFPDSLTVTKAIKHSVDAYYRKLKENYDFFGPEVA